MRAIRLASAIRDQHAWLARQHPASQGSFVAARGAAQPTVVIAPETNSLRRSRPNAAGEPSPAKSRGLASPEALHRRHEGVVRHRR